MAKDEYKARMNSHVTLAYAVNASIREHRLIAAGERILIAASGGTDSLALLHILMSLRDSLGCDLHVATLDHGLRGEAGADDARFVVETAQAWNIPVTSSTADVRALAAERRIGIEAAARSARYDFLAQVARAIGAHRVAVAHHAGDQVETVLLHLLRGSGLRGLSGMSFASPLPGHSDLTLIRPLLGITRADLEAYCHDHALHPRHDVSNDDLSLTRNRLRHETLPYLRDLAPGFDRRLLALAEIAALEDNFVDSALSQTIDPHLIHQPDRITLPRAIFVALHPALQRRFVLSAARDLRAHDITAQHVAAAVDLALKGQVGARALLTAGVQLRRDYDAIVVERESAPLPDDHPLLPTAESVIPVAIPGTTTVGQGGAAWLLTASPTPLEGDSASLAIPEGAEIILRGRRNGDRFAPQGLDGHTRKLKDWLIDRRVPRRHRDRLPLLVVGGEIAALYCRGWHVSAHFHSTQNPSHFIYISIAQNE